MKPTESAPLCMTSQEGTAGSQGYSQGHDTLEAQTAVGLDGCCKVRKKLWLLMESPSHVNFK